ncbi:E3 ubiquitin-protein ligase ATL31 [Spatholobus suberectus]|nr:E3 ubiquitin-protein ligase ATL31 [Spatholobus suberectus]
MLPKCEHVFHRHCIDAWLPSRITCPICRKRLTSDTVIGIDDDPTNVVPAEESEVAVTAAEQQPETETSDSSVVGQAVTSPALESRRFTPEDVRREIVANHGRIRLPGAWSRKTAWNASDSDQKRWFLSLSASKSCSLFT